ncbi:MAG: serine/threonine protein kinase, partial [Verrucomicrobiae bacterium]|nr:serine/threonine protein kinase [Verrucomicrobiae bacterium]
MAEHLPAFEVEEILGSGGMGAVYRARQISLNRMVAIKVLPIPAAEDPLRFRERFRREAQTMARLNHPAIVHVHDFGESASGLLYLVMEYVDGTDIQEILRSSRRIDADEAVRVVMEVCDALQYAHERGVIHRDIKPANVL